MRGFVVKGVILKEKMHDLRDNGVFLERNCVIFGLKGGFSKRKRMILGLKGGFSKRKCTIFAIMGYIPRENG